MRHKIVPVTNVAMLSEAHDALINRSMGMPGMGLIWGPTGFGKTIATTWLVNQCHGVYVRALATSTPLSLLGAIGRELDLEPRGSCANQVEQIVQKLAETGRPLFIDEADYIIDSKRMTETLRDIHDLAIVPVVLVGMAEIRRKITQRQQLSGRIAQWVEFGAASAEDARLIADTLCEVTVADDLLANLHAASGGSIRLMVVGLQRIEQHARARGLADICAADWRGGDDFFIGSAPAPAKSKAKPGKREIGLARSA